jgi:hypothetical protein
MAGKRERPSAVMRRLLKVLIRRPGSLTELRATELDLALRVARRARLLGRLACALDAQGRLDELPAQASEQLRSARTMVEARSRVTHWELNRVGWALRHRPGIRIVVLKGCAYALAGLPNAAGRSFADVDLLFAERDLATVERVLAGHGWRSKALTAYDQHYYRAWTHELPPMMHVEREVEVDLHHNILPRTGRLKPRSERLLAAAVPIPGTRFERLADTDLVLHAMTHLMFDSDMADSLRDLVDIDDLLSHFAADDPEFPVRLIERAAELDLSRPAFYAMRYAHRLLGTPVPQAALDRSSRSAPPAGVVRLMDRLAPAALFPRHPDEPSRPAGVARFLLYVRSLWIKMPPLLLVRHLAYKAWVLQRRRRS